MSIEVHYKLPVDSLVSSVPDTNKIALSIAIDMAIKVTQSELDKSCSNSC